MAAPQTKVDVRYRTERVLRYVEEAGGLGLEMMLIPGGEFRMGSPEDEADNYKDEWPQREVAVQNFLLGRYPVTQAQWRLVAGLPHVEIRLDPDPSRFKGNDRPVEKVNWHDAIEFCARLSRLTESAYRLPSEAEWEYACRAGTETPFHFGETISAKVANYRATQVYGQGAVGEYREETTPVGLFDAANAFGLSDMHGNVWEWCADPGHENYHGAPDTGRVWDDTPDRYENLEANLSELLADDRRRVRRGGSWGSDPGGCRSAIRNRIDPDIRFDIPGFRVARSAPRT